MEKVYNRADIVNFMGETTDATEFLRMSGFTDHGKSFNAQTYERRYVDEKTIRTDVIGYATQIAYTFDRIKDNKVHDLVASVHDEEKVGVLVPIISVNFNEKVEEEANTYKARKRMYSIIPDADGAGTDAYQYSGNFASTGEIVECKVTSSDGFKTITVV